MNTADLLSMKSSIVSEMRRTGICVIPGFYDRARCEALCAEIDSLLVTYESQLWKDPLSSDRRIFGANELSQKIMEFWSDEVLIDILNTYEQSDHRLGYTMAARLEAKDGNLGSGQGWHRDSANGMQTKAIVYLTDTGDKNGPFQYLEAFHTPLAVWYEKIRSNFKDGQDRFSSEEIEKLISLFPQRLRTVTGNAGDLILADTRGIHRGKPIEEGCRYAMTNYTWYTGEIPAHMKAVVVKP